MKTQAPPLPEHLQVEVSGACNLRCRMCLVRYAPAVGRREGALAYEDFLALVDLAADIGVDELWVQNLSHVFSDTDPAGAYDQMRRYAAAEALFADPETATDAGEIFARAAARARAAGLKLRLPHLREGATGWCSWPWDGSYITHRGHVQPCCMVMGSDRATLGRLADEPFSDIWAGEAYRAFRRGLLTHDPPAVCAGCSQYRGVF